MCQPFPQCSVYLCTYSCAQVYTRVCVTTSSVSVCRGLKSMPSVFWDVFLPPFPQSEPGAHWFHKLPVQRAPGRILLPRAGSTGVHSCAQVYSRFQGPNTGPQARTIRTLPPEPSSPFFHSNLIMNFIIMTRLWQIMEDQSIINKAMKERKYPLFIRGWEQSRKFHTYTKILTDFFLFWDGLAGNFRLASTELLIRYILYI